MDLKELKQLVLDNGGRSMPRNNKVWQTLFSEYQAAFANKSHPNRPKQKLKTSCGCRFTQAFDWIYSV